MRKAIFALLGIVFSFTAGYTLNVCITLLSSYAQVLFIFASASGVFLFSITAIWVMAQTAARLDSLPAGEDTDVLPPVIPPSMVQSGGAAEMAAHLLPAQSPRVVASDANVINCQDALFFEDSDEDIDKKPETEVGS